LRLFTSSNVDPLCACSSLLIEHVTEVGVRAVQRTHIRARKEQLKKGTKQFLGYSDPRKLENKEYPNLCPSLSIVKITSLCRIH